MIRAALLALAASSLLLAAGAEPAGAPLVRAEQAYSQAASQTGEWTALRAVSLPQSEMFVPQRVRVLEFGKGLPDPARATRWKTEQVWLSCDGSVGATSGRWAIPGTRQHGWYEAVWGRLRDGSYRMLLHRGGAERRKISGKPGRKGLRAACTGLPPQLPISAPAVGTDFRLGASHDQTLTWSSSVSDKGDLRIVISQWNGAAFVPVLEDVAPAPIPR